MEKKEKLYLHINVRMDREVDKQEYLWNYVSSYLGSMGLEYLGTSEYQPQARVFTEFTDKNISDDIPKGFVDIDGKLHKFEYNPEKKKDWEERTKKEFFNKFNWDYLFSKETKEIVWDYVKQLLLDREREAQIEVLTEIFQACYQEDSRTLELVEEKLSKLKREKK